MTTRSKSWLALSAIWTIANLVFVGMVLPKGELMHAAGHVALGLVGVYFIWRNGRALTGARAAHAADPAHSASRQAADDRLSRIEDNVDLVALELERIGEGQRFMTKIVSEQGGASAQRDAVDAHHTPQPG